MKATVVKPSKSLATVFVLIVALACFGCRSVNNQKLQDAALFGDLNQVELLLQNGANVNSTDNRGRTALYIASSEGKSNVVSYLLNHGADPNKGASWKGNQRPIHVAAKYGHVEIIQDLLRHGAKIDAYDSAKETALHEAAWYGRSAAVKCLLDEGANPNAKDIFGYTPLFFRYSPQDVKVLDGATGGPFASNFKEVAVFLVSAGADVNATAENPNGFTPLMAACAVAPVEVVDYLLSKGANVEAKSDTGATALSVAQVRNRTDIQKLLKKTTQ